MPLSINSNISAGNAARHLKENNQLLSRGLERLSAGLRTSRASADPAGLSVREGMRAELAGLQAGMSNAEQATNLVKTAEGSLNEVNAILIRMRELSTQAASSTLTDSNRTSLQVKFGQLRGEIDCIAQSTTCNKQALLTGFGNTIDQTSTALANSATTGVSKVAISSASAGTFTFVDAPDDAEITLGNGTVSQTISVGTILDGGAVATGTQAVANFDRLGIQVTLAGAAAAGVAGQFVDGGLNDAELVIESGTGGSFQVGAANSSFDRIEVSIPDMQASADLLNLGSASLASIPTARSALTSVAGAITQVARQRGNLGAVQNRLSFNIAATENQIEKLQASAAAIGDADVVSEVTQSRRAQILAQMATAMLAQANVQPQTALKLLTVQTESHFSAS